MAFELEAISGTNSITLTSAPYSLLRATGMGGAAVRRVTAQGPVQHGDTDLGYRLQPRQLELQIGIQAATDALLDGYRDDLVRVFSPTVDTSIQLRATRDDGEVRQLDCHVSGEVRIGLRREHRPGHYQEISVSLRAAAVPFYSPTAGSVSVVGTGALSPTWYLAGGAIDSANVLMVGTAPAQGATWSYTGTLGTGDAWTLAFRSGYVAPGSVNRYAYYVDNAFGDGTIDAAFAAHGTVGDAPYSYSVGGTTLPNHDGYALVGPGTIMKAGALNYFVRHIPSRSIDGLVFQSQDVLSGSVGAWTPSYGTIYSQAIHGTARRWRSDAGNSAASRWPEEIPLYALYDIALTGAQISALNGYMSSQVGGTVSQLVAVPYAGDLPEFPVIHLRGPITNPVVTNIVTGDKLDFGTITIGAGTTYVIDTRYGIKTITAGTVSKRSELTEDSDLATWRLLPHPIAQGGTNIVQMQGINASAATQISVIYHNRYTSL